MPDCMVLPVGSFPLKTYLPYADVDMVMFLPPKATSTSEGPAGGVGGESSGKEGRKDHEREEATDAHSGGDDGKGTGAIRAPALIAATMALCNAAMQASSKRGSPGHSRSWSPLLETAKPEIRNVSLINARTPIVTMVVGNVDVDLTENQGGSVAALALLEEADNLIQGNHLFKRSLLLLKAWAWCETPRLVGSRVLGARKGGLTSYGLSVMVLHLFASSASADALVHPLDVLIRFFEVYSEFDWARYCLTLDGPVPLESVGGSHPYEGSHGNGGTSSRFQPLVKKVLAELIRVPEKDRKKEREKAEEKDEDKAGRRGQRASRFGRLSDRHAEDALPGTPRFAAGVMPHFPKRRCNIQDPLNALNNLGYSVTKNNLKALKRALQQGRKKLEAWHLVSHPSPCRSHPKSDGALRRPREAEVSGTGRSQGVRSVEEKRDTRLFQAGVGVGSERAEAEATRREGEDRGMTGGGNAPGPQASLEPAAPVLEQFKSTSGVVHHLGPPAAAQLGPPPFTLHAQHPGTNVIVGPSLPFVPGAHPFVTAPRHYAVLAFPRPVLQAAPQQHQYVHQAQRYILPQVQPVAPWPNSAILVPTPGVQAHAHFPPQWQQLQRVFLGPGPHPGGHQLGPDQQRFSVVNGNVSSEWCRYQATARSDVCVVGPETATSQQSAPRGQEAKDPFADKEKCKGGRRKRQKETHDQVMQGPLLPRELPSFVNASPTSSTAFLSEDGSKDGQDCQSHCESGAEDAVHDVLAKESLFVLSLGDSDHSDTMADTRHQKRGEGQRAGMKRASGNLRANWFLREFFPECCQRYGSGDGFRDDLLDHPCECKIRLQEPGSLPPRRPDAPDVLQGAPGEVWKSLTVIGGMMREIAAQTNDRRKEESAQPRTETNRAAIGAEGGGIGGGRGLGRSRVHVGHQAGIEPRVVQAPRAALASTCTSGDRSALSANTGVDSRGLEVLRPNRVSHQVEDENRSQRRDGGRPTAATVRPQVLVDDETGYTTSEEQGDRECCTSCGGESREDGSLPSPPVEAPSLAKLFPVSSSTQTLNTASTDEVRVDVGVQCCAPDSIDQGVQCVVPSPKLRVSCASQCEPSRTSISTRVQCVIPAPTMVVSRASQSCSRAFRQASSGVQCSLLVEAAEGDGGAVIKALRGGHPSPSSPHAGVATVGIEDVMAPAFEDMYKEPHDSKEDLERDLPQSPGSGKTARVVPAVALSDSCTGGCGGDGAPAPRSKKRRKKAKAGFAAGRSAAAKSVMNRPSEPWSNAQGVGVGGWTRWLVSMAAFCGVVGLVLTAAGGALRGAGDASWQGGDRLTPRVVHEGQTKRAQPPLWVAAGRSLTLGDVRASRDYALMANDTGRVQWFRGGNVLPGQTRPLLMISEVSMEDEGTYACFAVEESGRIGSTPLWEEATVRISEPPLVESQLQSQRLARGEMLAIVATASGVPQPEYQWRRNGVPIPGATRPMLVKHGVSEADMGTYTCDVYNVAGRVQWEEMAVILREDRSKR
ncbi:unnamed protein product [Ectocarpus sp. CCAP 1310/34]|nr:unnamed protein product [Ectocarpus sp. CCAP 1310/34]